MVSSKETIAVVDFGGQYAHLIARRVRQLNVFSEIIAPDSAIEEFKRFRGIILSGGPASVYDEKAPVLDKKVFSLGIPILGICYGHQLLAKELGGKVERAGVREYGVASLHKKGNKGIFSSLPAATNVWMSHGDFVSALPEGFEVIGSTSDCDIAAMADFEKKIFGLQFHPEVTHTRFGMKILKNFVLKECNCSGSWTIRNFVEQKVLEIRAFAKGKNVFLLASGGVDSTVALVLLKKALGSKRILALHVDTGFMRKNESREIMSVFAKQGLNVKLLDASNEFIGSLKGVVEPEEKRKIIGNLFVKIVNENLERLDLNAGQWLLGQGTIYPDTIESAGTKLASHIKTHHNRVESIKQMIEDGKVIEPIRELYKDEVRELGKKLGLPAKMISRHPFPGPGLAIRILCSEKEEAEENIELQKSLDEIASKKGYKGKVLPIKSVGVQGDSRSYRNAAVIEGKLDWDLLEKTSTGITNSIGGISRVVFALQPKKIVSVALKKGFLEKERIFLLQEIDDFALKAIEKKKLYNKIWQFPIVLIPVSVNGKNLDSVVLRPVFSREAMTAKFARIEKKFLEKMALEIMQKFPVSGVFYDITHKPPGTIEWE
ncbi:MAG: glutamine-hydrolyzing GMP synthase [Candidatus ainarchaeum sp.]|nr:glutamine-hydrolyzing GMP synthase [Candidatus ainarchaeum sp.]